MSEVNFDKTPIEENSKTIEKPQQVFSFESEVNTQKQTTPTRYKYKLPSLDYLEKNLSKLSSSDLNKNRPEGGFMEKILLDFGIDGKIKAINNGPVVSLYEFEPAPGVKVSKIINLSDDIARNTRSESARIATIPGRSTIGIELPNSTRENVYLSEILSNNDFSKSSVIL